MRRLSTLPTPPLLAAERKMAAPGPLSKLLNSLPSRSFQPIRLRFESSIRIDVPLPDEEQSRSKRFQRTFDRPESTPLMSTPKFRPETAVGPDNRQNAITQSFAPLK